MPLMCGDKACATAREMGYTGPIVLLTGNTIPPAEREALIADAGFTAVLTKMAKPGVRAVLMRLGELKQRRGGAQSAGQ